MTAWEKQYFWKPSPKVMPEICRSVRSILSRTQIPIHTSHSHFLFASWSFWNLASGFYLAISLSGMQICSDDSMHVFPWVEAFPCRWVTPLIVAKTLLKRIIPTEEFPWNYIVIAVAHFIVQILNAIVKSGLCYISTVTIILNLLVQRKETKM